MVQLETYCALSSWHTFKVIKHLLMRATICKKLFFKETHGLKHGYKCCCNRILSCTVNSNSKWCMQPFHVTTKAHKKQKRGTIIPWAILVWKSQRMHDGPDSMHTMECTPFSNSLPSHAWHVLQWSAQRVLALRCSCLSLQIFSFARPRLLREC